jgi:hypothetical protein
MDSANDKKRENFYNLFCFSIRIKRENHDETKTSIAGPDQR